MSPSSLPLLTIVILYVQLKFDHHTLRGSIRGTLAQIFKLLSEVDQDFIKRPPWIPHSTSFVLDFRGCSQRMSCRICMERSNPPPLNVFLRSSSLIAYKLKTSTPRFKKTSLVSSPLFQMPSQTFQTFSKSISAVFNNLRSF
jgi:hypothetical protein